MTGWECPRCHRCYAPSVTECSRCPALGVVGGMLVPVTVPWFITCPPHDYDYTGTAPHCRRCGAMRPPLVPITTTALPWIAT